MRASAKGDTSEKTEVGRPKKADSEKCRPKYEHDASCTPVQRNSHGVCGLKREDLPETISRPQKKLKNTYSEKFLLYDGESSKN